MSLSTLLEAAKYLDYLDSNNHNQLQRQIQQHQQLLPIQQINKKATRRQRSSKKDAANTMLAMSLPTRPIHVQGVPIPVVSSDNHQAASLSSSFTTGSPLSSFASTALLCSKASGVTSASSSAASSLSSSESSSSCGEILMGDNDFNQPALTGGDKSSKKLHNKSKNSNNNHHNYHLTHQKFETDHQLANRQNSMNQFNAGDNHSVARYIAATSSGPQLVTMTTNSNLASASASVDGGVRAGHVIQTTNSGALIGSPGAHQISPSFDSRHYSFSSSGRIPQQGMDGHPAFTLAANSFVGENQLTGSPGSCPPLIMARVQPMILNSMSPSAQSIMAFQQATSSSPTSSSSSYSRHRELHKTLEKNRRAHLRHCFELLKAELPASECVDKKTSHINIIKSAIRYVLALRQQECEIDNELQRLTKRKMELTGHLSNMRQDNQEQTQQTLSDQQVITPFFNGEAQKDRQSPQQQQPEQQLSFLLSRSKID